MLIDLEQGAPDRLEADVAVIGAGAAGIATARRLVERGLSVALLESGGFDYEAETAELNDGENVGEPYYDLDSARLRFFGGTTAIWGGRCAHLDPIDFERRDWVPHSGWPFDAVELEPWYAEARGLLGLPRSRAPRGKPNGLLGQLADDDLAVQHWEFDHQFDRFGADRNSDLLKHPKLTVAVHATVREIVALPSGKAISHLEVLTPGGKRVEVHAPAYVLAAGGIENPRLLLASNSVAKCGLGNQNDLVGRFFMEHPHGRGGTLTGAPAWRVLSAFSNRQSDGAVVAPLLTASTALQARSGLLNSALTIAARRPEGGRHSVVKRAYIHAKHKVAPTELARSLWKVQRLAGRQVKQYVGPLFPWLGCTIGSFELALVLRAEQAPNPASRVTLGTEVDRTGMPRVKLDWRLCEQDVHTACELVAAVSRAFERRGLGRLEPAEWLEGGSRAWQFDPVVSAHPIGGFHHMGTTRMADDPRQGVTDREGRVHGIDNLYVAGSSLFPTGGWANPTLTILALALRTAERIAARKESGATYLAA
jgi:choline dehydrogenase-like flavoprotein